MSADLRARGACLVRRIATGDADGLRQFYNALGPAVHRIFRPLGWDAKLEACEAIVADNAAAPERRYDLLALDGDAIAGWGFLWDLHTESPSFGLGIAATHRGQGLGARLMDAVMNEARRRGVRRVLLTVVTDNAVAQRLYARQGFVRYGQYVDEKDGVPYYRMAWPDAPPQAEAPRPLRLAFIGTGNWARRYHLPALDRIRGQGLVPGGLTLHGIHGLDTAQVCKLGGQYGFARVYDSLDELVADRELDAVAVVVSPGATHGVVRRLAPRGVPVFTEKPPGMTAADAADLAACVRAVNVVGFNRRYNALNNRFRELLPDLGPLRRVRGEMHRLERREADFVRGTGVHLINLLEYLCGAIADAVCRRRPHPSTGATLYEAQLAFASGLAGELCLAPCSDRMGEGVTVETDDHIAVLHSPHNDRPGEITVRRRGEAGGPGEVVARSGAEPPVVEEGYVPEYLDLFGAMRDGHDTRSNFRNAANALRVAEAMERGATRETA